MKLSDIIRQVNNDTSQNYSNQAITDWANRCLDQVSLIAQKQVKVTLNSADPLPSDLLRIVKIVVDSQEMPYSVFANQVELENNPLTYDLYYIRNLTYLDPDKLDGVPEIESHFHDLLVLYATYQSQYQEEEPQKEADAYARYQSRLEEYKRFKNGPNASRFIVDVYGIGDYIE